MGQTENLKTFQYLEVYHQSLYFLRFVITAEIKALLICNLKHSRRDGASGCWTCTDHTGCAEFLWNRGLVTYIMYLVSNFNFEVGYSKTASDIIGPIMMGIKYHPWMQRNFTSYLYSCRVHADFMYGKHTIEIHKAKKKENFLCRGLSKLLKCSM